MLPKKKKAKHVKVGAGEKPTLMVGDEGVGVHRNADREREAGREGVLERAVSFAGDGTSTRDGASTLNF
jgi:hypothetical protein